MSALEHSPRREITMADSLSVDAFGRQRVSMAQNRFDYDMVYGIDDLVLDEVTSGNATATFDSNARDIVMAVTETDEGTSKALYSHIDIPYTAGNSQVAAVTGTLDNTGLGTGVASVFLRSKVSGSVVEQVIPQTSWGVYTNSRSIDWTKSQIFEVDFQSLRVGRIRFGFARGGEALPVHAIANDNLRATGYWQRPSLPVYWRQYNATITDDTYDGVLCTVAEMGYGDTENAIGLRYAMPADATATMRAICSTVKSEAGDRLRDLPGLPFSIDSGVSTVSVSTTLVPILAVRVASTFKTLDNRMLVRPESFELNTNNPIRYAVYYRPTITGGSWSTVALNSGMEYNATATVIGGGTLIASGYLSTNKNLAFSDTGELGKIYMALGRTGVSDVLAIAAVRNSATDATVQAAIRWEEIR